MKRSTVDRPATRAPLRSRVHMETARGCAKIIEEDLRLILAARRKRVLAEASAAAAALFGSPPQDPSRGASIVSWPDGYVCGG
jgi:hypothetical protein